MASARARTLIRIGKPLLAGLAFAYLLTAFVDKPAPIHFQPGNPYASKQAEVAEPQAAMVLEKNVMKLGSPLSMTPGGHTLPQDNPLAGLEPDFEPFVRGEVELPPIPLPRQ